MQFTPMCPLMKHEGINLGILSLGSEWKNCCAQWVNDFGELLNSLSLSIGLFSYFTARHK